MLVNICPENFLDLKEKEIKKVYDLVISYFNESKWYDLNQELSSITDSELEVFSVIPEMNGRYEEVLNSKDNEFECKNCAFFNHRIFNYFRKKSRKEIASRIIPNIRVFQLYARMNIPVDDEIQEYAHTAFKLLQHNISELISVFYSPCYGMNREDMAMRFNIDKESFCIDDKTRPGQPKIKIRNACYDAKKINYLGEIPDNPIISRNSIGRKISMLKSCFHDLNEMEKNLEKALVSRKKNEITAGLIKIFKDKKTRFHNLKSERNHFNSLKLKEIYSNYKSTGLLVQFKTNINSTAKKITELSSYLEGDILNDETYLIKLQNKLSELSKESNKRNQKRIHSLKNKMDPVINNSDKIKKALKFEEDFEKKHGRSLEEVIRNHDEWVMTYKKQKAEFQKACDDLFQHLRSYPIIRLD